MPTIPTCTAQLRSGAFCDAPSLDAAPFPICARHARQVYEWAGDMLRARDLGLMRPAELVPLPPVESEPHVVYYLRIGDHIKIGTTYRLDERVKAYPPGVRVLATEVGDRSVEGRRLRQFNEYLAYGREWFHPGARLLDHIAALRGEAA